jgi:non-ribosomal peptide synthetase component F
MVLARAAGRDDVVFGTLLFGRTVAGAADAVGLFVNTLPIRVTVDETPVAVVARAVHDRLAGLLRHEHAPLALAQRCSAVPAGVPLFTALLNYRHSASAEPAPGAAEAWSGIEVLDGEERTSYPLTMSVDDTGEVFVLNALALPPLDPQAVCAAMAVALERLVDAIESRPQTPASAIDALSDAERERLVDRFNATEVDYPRALCVHELFEQQVRRTPGAVALVDGARLVTYADLDRRADALAQDLRRLGAAADARVARRWSLRCSQC